MHRAYKAESWEEAQREWDSQPISLARLAGELWEVIKDEEWVLANGNRRGWARRLWDWTKPHQYLGGSGGAGLGYGMPAAVGVALAHRDTGKLCLNVQNDGDMLYTCSAIWTSTHHRIPLLVVMNNNRVYGNSARHRVEMNKLRRRGTNLQGNLIDDPSVDFAEMARSYGAYGIGPIEEPQEIGPALEEAIKIVKEKRTLALVDMITKLP
jgi:thiamine pyrophosphate-dependent acetolactate synthase large subunit-like protein